MATSPASYSSLQITLHWAVVVLVAFQFIAHDGIEDAWEGRAVSSQGFTLAYLHIISGIVIFILASLRVFLRATRGVPPPPTDEPRLLHYVAEAVHASIYLCLFVMPITGAAAWFLDWDWAADAHALLQIGLLGAIGLHVAGALFQHFILRSNVLMRMLSVTDMNNRENS